MFFSVASGRLSAPAIRKFASQGTSFCGNLSAGSRSSSRPPMATRGVGTRQDFSGSSLPELLEWLDRSGIDTSAWGGGASKSLDLLCEEVQEGETVLTLAQGKALRLVSVVNVLISNSKGQALSEAQQVLPSGAVRERRKPLSEKLLPGERWQDGALRGIKEELGSILPADPQVTIDEASYEAVIEEKESQSYPGLHSKYTCHRVAAKVVGLPEEDFTTEEQRADGLLTHRWVWE